MACEFIIYFKFAKLFVAASVLHLELKGVRYQLFIVTSRDSNRLRTPFVWVILVEEMLAQNEQ